MKTLNVMTRKELAGRWFDLQVARKIIPNRNRDIYVYRCLHGVGYMKPMKKDELVSCCENAQKALERGE